MRFISIFNLLINRLHVWQERSVNRRIFSAALTVAIISLAVKFVALLKEQLVAYQFGTSDSLDAFLIAFIIPSFIVTLVAGSFVAAFMPTFIEVREQKGREVAQNLLSNVILLSTVLLIIVSSILALTSSYVISLIGAGFNPEKLQLTQRLLFVLLPFVIVSGATYIWSAALNANERFILVAVSPVITSIVSIFFLVIFSNTWGIYALATGLVAGSVASLGIIAIGMKTHQFTIIPRWTGFDPETKQVIRQFAPMVVGALLMSSTTLVDQSMAATLESGSVSILNYSNKVVALFLGLSAVSLSTAILPYFSKMVASKDWSGIKHSLKVYTRLIIVISVPIVLLLMKFSTQLVRLIFERGAFTEADTILVGHVQAMLLIQVPFYVLGMLFVRLITSLKANKILMYGTIINFVVNITLNYVFMKWIGIEGIALSTSIVYIISFCFLAYTGTRHLNKRILEM